MISFGGACVPMVGLNGSTMIVDGDKMMPTLEKREDFTSLIVCLDVGVGVRSD